MKRINPFLWFNDNAVEAAYFYASIFETGKVTNRANASAKALVATFEIASEPFLAINGGPQYSITPSISFFVQCESEQQIDTLWKKLSENGTTLMPLDRYPFSEKFGWVKDKFGVTWQLNLSRKPQTINTFLMYGDKMNGRAEEAVKYYVSLFPNSHVDALHHFEAGEPGDLGTVKHAKFTLNGEEFSAMDSNRSHGFTFTPGLSLYINCETQEEVDDLWEKLSEGGRTDRCGWLQDKFGVSWQIIPTQLPKFMMDKDPAKSQRVMQAMLKMTKIEISGLQQAYEQA